MDIMSEIQKARRIIKKLIVHAISLTAPPIIGKSGDAPANGFDIVLKSDGSIVPMLATKISAEKQMVYGIVYAPGRTDSQGEIVVDPDVIREAAYDFMKIGVKTNVDVIHDGDYDQGAYVAESWLTKEEGDPFFPPMQYPVGSWVVGIKVDNPDLWKRIKEKELGGLSLFGVTQVASANPIEKTDLDKEDVVKDKLKPIYDSLHAMFGSEAKKTKEPTEEPKEETPMDDRLSTLQADVAEITKAVKAVSGVLNELKPHLDELKSHDEAASKDIEAVRKTAEDLSARVKIIENAPVAGWNSIQETVAEKTKEPGLWDSLIPQHFSHLLDT